MKLEIDPTVTPVAQPSRKIPHSMKSKVNKKLAEMRDEGIIEKVEGATPWLSLLIAIPKKSGDLRLVLDMHVPNTALVRRRVQIPTVNEMLQKMEGAKVFTEVDLSQGYLQLTLETFSFAFCYFTANGKPHFAVCRLRFAVTTILRFSKTSSNQVFLFQDGGRGEVSMYVSMRKNCTG